MDFAHMAVMITAKSRPDYLTRTLTSWKAARGITEVRAPRRVALGWDDAKYAEMVMVIEAARKPPNPCHWLIKPDSTAARASNGMARAIAECVTAMFADPQVDFVVMGEEDVIVSDDVLELMAWGAGRFRDDKRVLAVNGHDEGGQGWCVPGIGALNGDADQWAIRLNQSFNPWCWGTWRDRWFDVLEPAWDYEVNSGGAMDSGHDHHLARRVIPNGGYLCVTPDASRSQNIGQYGGWAADPAKFGETQSASFRQERGPGEYRLVTAEAPAVP